MTASPALPSWWTLLIADPEPVVDTRLAAHWSDAGGTLVSCRDGASALYLAGREAPDVILLAASLTDIRLDVVVRALREHGSAPIMLAVGSGETEILGDQLGLALMAGASELIPRPYVSGEGLAHLEAQVERLRHQREGDVTLVRGRVRIDVARFEARVDQQSLALTVREFKILYFLMSNYDRAVRAQEILDAVWGPAGHTVSANTLAVHVVRLRKALGAAAQIAHVRGVGYRMTVPDDTAPT